jgi:hypothetical protein
VHAIAGVAAVAAGLGLGGCGTPEAGAAAVVGDRRISVSELQQATEDIQKAGGQDLQVSQQRVLTVLILEPYVVDVAARNGVGVSTYEGCMAFASTSTSCLPGETTLSDAALLAMRGNAAIGKLQSGLDAARQQKAIQEILTAVERAGVHVNPRYGRFDPATTAIVPAQENWLAPSAAPTPQQ